MCSGRVPGPGCWSRGLDESTALMREKLASIKRRRACVCQQDNYYHFQFAASTAHGGDEPQLCAARSTAPHCQAPDRLRAECAPVRRLEGSYRLRLQVQWSAVRRLATRAPACPGLATSVASACE